MTHYHETYIHYAIWDRDKYITILGQKVKSQGHGGITYAGTVTAQSVTRRPVSSYRLSSYTCVTFTSKCTEMGLEVGLSQDSLGELTTLITAVLDTQFWLTITSLLPHQPHNSRACFSNATHRSSRRLPRRACAHTPGRYFRATHATPSITGSKFNQRKSPYTALQRPK